MSAEPIPGRLREIRMKYYDEDRMRPVREAFDAEVLTWPGATSRGMMGCHVYLRGRSFFAFLVNDGLVLTKLSEEERRELAARMETKPFEMAGRATSKWSQVAVERPEDLQATLPFVRKSYEAIAD